MKKLVAELCSDTYQHLESSFISTLISCLFNPLCQVFFGGGRGFVSDYYQARCSDLLESLLVSWQPQDSQLQNNPGYNPS